MKKYFLLAAGVLGLLLCSCKADVDLDNLDSSIYVEKSISAPIGSLSATLGDFLKTDKVNGLDIEDGIYTFGFGMDTTIAIDAFLNLNSFMGFEAKHGIDLKSSSPAINALVTSFAGMSYTLPADIELPLNFPLNIDLKGLNRDEDTLRVDSIRLSRLHLQLRFEAEGHNIPLSDLESVEILLNGNFYLNDGTPKRTISLVGKQYGEYIDIDLNNSTLNLFGQTTDSVKLGIGLNIHMKAGHNYTLQSAPMLNVYMKLVELDYEAIYGRFDMDVQSRGGFALNLDVDGIKDWSLPANKATIDLHATSALGIPLTLDLGLASFQNGTQTALSSYTYIAPQTSWIWPYDPIDKRTSYDIHLGCGENEGNIGKLFAPMPDSIGYTINFDVFDSATYSQPPFFDQFRITRDLNIGIGLDAKIPFSFDEGLRLGMKTDMPLDMSGLDLNDLTGGMSIGFDSLLLCITAENGLPFELNAKIELLDENDQIVLLESDKTFYKLEMPCPEDIDANGKVVTPKIHAINLHMTEDMFNKLTKVKKLSLDAKLLNPAQKASLSTDASLKLDIVVTKAQAHMTIDLSGKEAK